MATTVDFIDDVADYLEDQSIGTVGTDIFVGRLEDETDNQIVLINTGGQPDIDLVQSDGKSMRTIYFQVMIRNTSYATGYAKLAAIRNLLHRQINLTLTNYRALNILAVSDGGAIGQDEEGRNEFSINFTARAHST